MHSTSKRTAAVVRFDLGTITAESPRVSSASAAWLLTVAVSVGFYAIFIWRSAFTVSGRLYFSLFDDAMVSMRYARHLAEGQGLVWNIGQPAVEGYSNPLWTLWMSVLHLTGAPIPLVSLLVMVSGIALLIAGAAVAWCLAIRVGSGSTTVAAITAASVALYYPLVFWTLRGMEVGLLALLIGAALLIALRVVDRPSALATTALCATVDAALLTRLDAIVGAAVLAAYLAIALKGRQRSLVVAPLVATILAALAAQTAFRLAYYGELLPNTYYLKLTGASIWDRVQRGAASLVLVSFRHLYPILMTAGFALFPARASARGSRRLLAALVAGYMAYSVYVGGDAWEWMGYANRYVAVAMPALIVLAIAALEELSGSRRRRVLLMQLLLGATAVRALVELALLRVNRAVHPEYWQAFQQHPTAIAALLVTIAVACVVTMAALAMAGWKTRPTHGASLAVAARPTNIAVAAAMLWVLTNGQPVGFWVARNGFHVTDDARAAKVGLAIRESTREDAWIAVSWAGAIPYFAERNAIDVLGKSDTVIARMKPVIHFVPGHNKWNLDHSIASLKPDVVFAPLQWPYLLAQGYEPIAATAFVRRSSDRVDRQALRSRLVALVGPP